MSLKLLRRAAIGWRLNNGQGSPAGEEGKRHSIKEKIFCAKVVAGEKYLSKSKRITSDVCFRNDSLYSGSSVEPCEGREH